MLACTEPLRTTDRPTRRPRQGGPVFLPRRKLSAFGASLLEPRAGAGPDAKRQRPEVDRAAVLGAGVER